MAEAKSTEERRREIVEAARRLFHTKGYEETSTADIMNAVGIAKGTLYYHFSSKEEILDALLEDVTDRMASAALPYGNAQDLSHAERMVGVIRSLRIAEGGAGDMLETLHLPQNALYHQKSYALTIQKISPVMLAIVEDGVRQGVFHTVHPESAVHIAMSYSMTALEGDALRNAELVDGFVYHLERMLGAAEGSLARLRELFD